MTQTRRTFIKVTSLASATLVPVIRTLAQVLGKEEEEISPLFDGSFNKEFEFHIIDNNLINLHFYFINVYRKKGYLYPKDDGKPSFAIIRLPQQHISEKGYWENEPPVHPKAELSGFSYLAFQLWYRQDTSSDGEKIQKIKQIPLDKSLLNWNNKSWFKLISLTEWLQLKDAKSELKFIDCVETIEKKNWTPIDQLTTTVDTRFEPASFIYLKYKSIIQKLLKDENNEVVIAKNKNFVPITFFEIPYRLFITPLYPSKRLAGDEIIIAKFWTNNLVGEASRDSKVNIRKYEVWNNTLYYQREKTKLSPKTSDTKESKQGSNSSDNNIEQFVIEKPYFRAIGFYSEGTVQLCSGTETPCGQLPPKYNMDENTLPTLLDKEELTYLTQYANAGADADKDFTGGEFDIKELNGFFFTGLGTITHLKYNNVENKPKGIDLIEYEHIITQGRDILVKVARLGYNCKTGQKYKHVIEASRKIGGKDGNAVSFMELKQYCECIEGEISYLDKKDEWDKINDFYPIQDDPKCLVSNDIILPVFGSKNPCHFRRLPYTGLTTVEKERIPIDILQDNVFSPRPIDLCLYESKLWFWPILENKYLDGTADNKIALENYLMCDYDARDWENNSVKAKTPFMFIRASLLEGATTKTIGDFNEVYCNYLKGAINNGLINDNEQVYFERRKTYFNGQKIAHTPSLPNSENLKNKTNIIETNFHDLYFRIRPSNGLPAQKVKYILFPQELRKQVYIDHIRDLTLKKIASVVEYHHNYITDEFVNRNEDGKQIIKNTAAFIGKGIRIINGVEREVALFEEHANQTYATMSNALQEAKDKLGNIAVPDIIPDTVSLKRLGITLPIDPTFVEGEKVVNGAIEKFKQLDPRELLRGKFSEILGGIDLREILAQLIPEANTPLFEINKLVNKIDDADILNSAVYKEITDVTLKDPFDVADPKDYTPSELIKKYDDKISNVLQQIKRGEDEIKSALEIISDKIPNTDQLNNLLKNLFEQYRTQAFEFDMDQLHFNDVKSLIDTKAQEIKSFFVNEIRLLQSEYLKKKGEIQSIIDDIPNQISQAVASELASFPDLQKCLNQISSDGIISKVFDAYNSYFPNDSDLSKLQNFLDGAFNRMLVTVDDSTLLKVNSKIVYFDPNTFSFESDNSVSSYSQFTLLKSLNTGYLQLQRKVQDILLFITKNVNGNSFQQSVVSTIQQEYFDDERQLFNYNKKLLEIEGDIKNYSEDVLAEYTKTLDSWINIYDYQFQEAIDKGLSGTTQEAILKTKQLVIKINPYIDFLRKIDPYFYYTEYERLRKDADDTLKRFKQEVSDQFIKLKLEAKVREIYVNDYRPAFDNYVKALKDYSQGLVSLDKLNEIKTEFIETQQAKVLKELNGKVIDLIDGLKMVPEYKQIADLYDKISTVSESVKIAKEDLLKQKLYYENLVKQEANDVQKTIENKVNDFIDKQEEKLINSVGADNLIEIQNNIEEARNIYRLLTSIKQQDLTYNWTTSHFRDVSLGIVTFKKFSNPDTQLSINVKATTKFSSGKFPPAIDSVQTYSENRFTNFGISLFSILNINFSEISFSAGTDQHTHFDVKIKNVQFDGALAFVQKFEDSLKTLDTGLILKLEPDHVALGYSLPIPSIQTPGFSFFNLTLNFDFRLYFDKTPMRFGFSMATVENKFGIAVYIFAGFGYFSIVAEPKRGIVEIDAALEAGAWAGFSLGPIYGEVKLAFGFRYIKGDFGTRLEGYIVAEGRLTIWIIEASARIYLGIVSENSSVEGSCTVTYSVSLGFFKKSFSGTFHKRIAGAENNNHQQMAEKNAELIVSHFSTIASGLQWNSKFRATEIYDTISTMTSTLKASDNKQLIGQLKTYYGNDTIMETYCVVKEDWDSYFNRFK